MVPQLENGVERRSSHHLGLKLESGANTCTLECGEYWRGYPCPETTKRSLGCVRSESFWKP